MQIVEHLLKYRRMVIHSFSLLDALNKATDLVAREGEPTAVLAHCSAVDLSWQIELYWSTVEFRPGVFGDTSAAVPYIPHVTEG